MGDGEERGSVHTIVIRLFVEVEGQGEVRKLRSDDVVTRRTRREV